MKVSCLVFAALLSAAPVQGSEKLIEKDVPSGKTLHLTEFGGPDVRIKVNSVYPSSIYVTITDYTRMVPVTRAVLGEGAGVSKGPTTLQEQHEAMMVPTSETRKVPKKNGATYGDLKTDMFLVYEEQRTGLKVYVADNANAPVNTRTLVIAVPTPEIPAPRVVSPAPPAPSIEPAAPKPVTRDFAAWYRGLQQTRASLDLSDPDAVQRYKERLEEYNKAVQKSSGAKR